MISGRLLARLYAAAGVGALVQVSCSVDSSRVAATGVANGDAGSGTAATGGGGGNTTNGGAPNGGASGDGGTTATGANGGTSGAPAGGMSGGPSEGTSGTAGSSAMAGASGNGAGGGAVGPSCPVGQTITAVDPGCGCWRCTWTVCHLCGPSGGAGAGGDAGKAGASAGGGAGAQGMCPTAIPAIAACVFPQGNANCSIEFDSTVPPTFKDGECCYVLAERHGYNSQCPGAFSCACGRPFPVEGKIRVAALSRRGEWT